MKQGQVKLLTNSQKETNVGQQCAKHDWIRY